MHVQDKTQMNAYRGEIENYWIKVLLFQPINLFLKLSPNVGNSPCIECVLCFNTIAVTIWVIFHQIWFSLLYLTDQFRKILKTFRTCLGGFSQTNALLFDKVHVVKRMEDTLSLYYFCREEVISINLTYVLYIFIFCCQNSL